MTARTLADLTVGDAAVVLWNRGTKHEVTVTKVARVYVTVSGASWHETQFRIDTGEIRGGGGGTGYSTWLRTQEQIESAERYGAAVARLRDLGLEIRHGYGGDFMTETLEAIIAAIPVTNSTKEG